MAGIGEFDMPDNFTFREMNFIKKMTGLRAGEVYPALEVGDTDVIAAFALTAIRRSDQAYTEDSILDLEITQIELVVEDSDKEAGDGEVPPDPEGGVAQPSESKPASSPPLTTVTPAATG